MGLGFSVNQREVEGGEGRPEKSLRVFTGLYGVIREEAVPETLKSQENVSIST